MTRQQASDFDQGLLDLFDQYIHGQISRREFLDQAASFATVGVSAAALLESLNPRYSERQQVRSDDPQVRGEYVEYSSPRGAGTMRGYMVRPADSDGDLPGVVVVHENRGLNPHIEDVARRTALAGFLAFAPDALTPLGGYPGNDDDGRDLQRQRDRDEMGEDFVAAGGFLKSHAECSGAVGVVGFCYGGGICNMLAVRVPDLRASVPFYGGQPAEEDVSRINAPLLIHYAGLDTRINAGWAAYEAALTSNDKSYTMHMYEGANHGFHNDTTPRYDEVAAKLAWQRTIDFFNRTLR
jgi:carboxymethylenebutenolidase